MLVFAIVCVCVSCTAVSVSEGWVGILAAKRCLARPTVLTGFRSQASKWKISWYSVPHTHTMPAQVAHCYLAGCCFL